MKKYNRSLESDYPLGIIGTVPMAFEEMLAYEAIHGTNNFKRGPFF